MMHLHPETILVGGKLEAECLVRDNPRVNWVHLYKDGVLVLSRNDGSVALHIPNINSTHQGTYTCKASWIQGGDDIVAESDGIPVTVQGEISVVLYRFSLER